MGYSYVNGTIAGSSSSSPVTTSPIDTTGATLLVVAVACGSTGPSTITDSKGNQYLCMAPVAYNSGPNFVELYYCNNPIVGTGHTFTATSSPLGRAFPSIGALAFSGVAESAADVFSWADAASVSSVQPGSVTPSANGELIITAAHGWLATGLSVDSGFTAFTAGSTANNYALGLAYLIQTTAAPIDPTWTLSASETYPIASIIAFKPSASGGGSGGVSPWEGAL